VLDSTFDKALSQTVGSGPFCQTYQVTPNQQATYQPATKVICKLDCSGVLSMPTGLPIVATGPIDIELDLADAADCLCPSGQTQGIAYTATQGNPVGNGFTNILIPPQSIFSDGAVSGFSQAGYLGANIAAALATTPFAIGNTLTFGASTFNGVATPAFTGVQAVITAAAAVGANIQLTVTTAAGANVGIGLGVAADPIVGTFSMAIGTIQVGAAFVTNPTQYSYQITQPEYVVRAVEMPPPYIASLQKRIQSEQLQLDIPTYSTYLATIQAGITQQAISVPAFQSRVQSIITIPQPSAPSAVRALARRAVGLAPFLPVDDWRAERAEPPRGHSQHHPSLGGRRAAGVPVARAHSRADQVVRGGWPPDSLAAEALRQLRDGPQSLVDGGF
jgi:hypothetical protein